MAFPTGWLKKHKIVIDHTKVSGSANLTNIPIEFNESNFLSAIFDNSQGKEIISNNLYSDANLQGYWRLESDGEDLSSNGYDVAGAVRGYVSGKFGNGADFELGNSDYLSIADTACADLEISGSQTWSAWIKLESTVPSGRYAIMAKRDTSNTGHWLRVGSTMEVGLVLPG
jgi:hypothetical protein